MMVGTHQPQKLDLGRIVRISKNDPEMMREYRDYLHMSHPEGILAYYVMSSDEVREFAVTDRQNTDDHPRLEFNAPRQLFTDTRDLNVALLYDAKGGLIPPGVEIPDPETAYGAMIEPFLFMDRSNLANQAMALLAQLPQRHPWSLNLAMAQLNLDADDLTAAEESLKRADETMPSQGPLYAEKEELWGTLYDKLGSDADAALHFMRAATADPNRSIPHRKLAEISARNQDWPEAAKWMQGYIDTKPDSPGHYWAMLGDYYLADENTEEASNALQTALKIDPYSYWARFRMARVFEQSEEKDKAIEQYEFIIRYAYDRDADVYVTLANLYKEANRPKDVLRVLDKGHRIFPTNVELYRLYREAQGAE
jgi:tetratricopeptide (TPR) repeat protein